MRWLHKALACVIAISVAVPLPTAAQQERPATPFNAEELDQLAASIALYPDPLLAQVFMASTYPLEIVQAARFAKDNPGLKEAQLDEALKKQSWDDSVKSLVAFPQVLAMMDAKLDWTQKLGDAFLAQQKELMDAVQRLRARVQAEGNLKSTAQQNVTVEPAPAAAPPAPPAPPAQAPAPPQVIVQQAPATVITIQPANPQVVYVPTYNPTVVYGAWPYPAYPPSAYYPPGYVAGAAMFSFAAGVAVGGALWGNCNWHGGSVNVNVNQYNSYSRTVNTTNVAAQRTQIQNTNVQGGASNWQHNPEHRKGAQYRDPATQQRYNKSASPQATQARDSFRGRAEQGRQELSRGGAEQFRQGGTGSGPRPSQTGAAGAGSRPGSSQTGAAGAGSRPGSSQTGAAGRGASPGAQGARPEGARAASGSAAGQSRGSSGGTAFQGMGQGREVQQFSARGQASRDTMNADRAASAQGKAAAGGARSGGGAARSGGGRRR
jgi:Protein of unknown function (DUF3300)